MTEPTLQTRLNVVAGTTADPRMTFVWGQTVSPITVGVRGEWAITAPGVLDVHFFVSFDGRQVHVAAASAQAPLRVRDQLVEQQWRPVPVPSEIAFGNARISVVCEERRPSSPAQGLGATWAVDAAGRMNPPGQGLQGTVRLASPEEIAQMRSSAPADAAHPRQPPQQYQAQGSHQSAAQADFKGGGTAFVQSADQPGVQPLARSPSGAPGAAAAPLPAGAGVMRPMPASVTHLSPHAAATGPTLQPPAAVAAVPPATPRVLEAPQPGQVQGFSPGHTVPSEVAPAVAHEDDDVPVSTVADGGRLKMHAQRASDSVQVPQISPAAGSPAGGGSRNTHQSGSNVTVPSPAVGMPPAAVPGAGQDDPGLADAPVADQSKPWAGLGKAWRETSLVKKIILGLLPIAAVTMLFDPIGAPPAPRAKLAKKESAEGLTRSAASASAPSAAAIPQAEATGSAAGTETAPISSDQALELGAPAESAPIGPAASASAAPAGDSSMLPKVALDAAFKGHHAEASEFYENLSRERPKDPAFPLAARLAREGAVRKP